VAEEPKNKKRFNAVNVIAVVVILILAAVIGWLVYKSHHHVTPTTSLSSSKVYKGWKSYSDSAFSFKYPADWEVDKPPAKIASGPIDATLVGSQSTIPSYLNASSSGTIELLNFSFYKSLASLSGCTQKNSICRVELVEPLNTKGLASPKLVVFSEKVTCTQGETCGSSSVSNYELVDSATIKAGDSYIPQGLKAGGKTYQLIGCSLITGASPVSGGSICGTINNYRDFESSIEYKNLVNVLDSLTIK